MFIVRYLLYTLWLLIHLLSTALWMVLCILLIYAIAGWLCKKSRHKCHSQGHCSCRGRFYGHAQYHDYHHVRSPEHLDALEILRQRYARGEIDDTTFQHMRERLGPSTEPERRLANDE